MSERAIPRGSLGKGPGLLPPVAGRALARPNPERGRPRQRPESELAAE
jgi:hypothetical protein